jgi:hypothetical protein
MVRFVTLCVLGAALLQAKPDFSGEWKMDAKQSDFGSMPAPESMVVRIDHKDPEFKVRTQQTGGPIGDFTADAFYSTDGKERTNSFQGNTSKSTHQWDDEAIKGVTRLDYQGRDVGITERWSLSGDGKILRIERRVTTPQSTVDQTVVLIRQEPEKK